MIDKAEVGKRITALRKKLGYSQGMFAEKLNVSTQAVSKWETGLALPDIDILLNISWMCRVSINNILEGDDDVVGEVPGIDRGLQRLNKLLMCPQCKSGLKLSSKKEPEKLSFECEQGHKYDAVDGVVFFGTREITGELWSLWLRNYEQYLEVQRHPGNPRYMQGEVPYKEVVWREMEKRRPRIILDIGSGTCNGIKYMAERINWPCMIILTDLSHRILKWNNRFFSEELRNPYVDIVCLACDCANLPVCDNTVDMVTSTGGFESMQGKMMDGFREAYRVLKQGASAIYGMSVVDDHKSANTKKWIELFSELDHGYYADRTLLVDIDQWKDKCTATGFSHTDAVKIYGEMPAPSGDVFPFENEILQWMAEHVVISRK